MQQKENAKKNTKHSRNKTILKIGHLAKAIAFARWPIFKIVLFLECLVFFLAFSFCCIEQLQCSFRVIYRIFLAL